MTRANLFNFYFSSDRRIHFLWANEPIIPSQKRRTIQGLRSLIVNAAVERAERFRVAASRETVEAFIVAFILALLFRAFLAEAFVIPTGSMAPTLMGAHKDISCSQCGTSFQCGASRERSDPNPILLLSQEFVRTVAT